MPFFSSNEFDSCSNNRDCLTLVDAESSEHFTLIKGLDHFYLGIQASLGSQGSLIRWILIWLRTFSLWWTLSLILQPCRACECWSHCVSLRTSMWFHDHYPSTQVLMSDDGRDVISEHSAGPGGATSRINIYQLDHYAVYHQVNSLWSGTGWGSCGLLGSAK